MLHFAAVDADRPDVQVGYLVVGMVARDSPTEANKHIAWVQVAVLAPHRRRGIGRKLLSKAAALAKERSKSLIVSNCDEEDGKAFIKAIGAQVAQKRQENRLYLDRVDWQMVERWAEAGPSRSPNATLQWFVNRIDDGIIEDYCKMYTETFNQRPLDELGVDDVIFTPEMHGEREATNAEVGGKWLTAITREADGDTSGLTEMIYTPDKETMIQQLLTGVKETYRGSGLGKWLKAAMLLRFRKKFPQVKVVTTDNATSNAAMLSINERLGFKTHKEPITTQITLESLERYLDR
jgi:GNAT superfamily N-acetyltransferase